jgi:hypothetical protein
VTGEDFLKDQYDGEITRRYQLAGSLSLPIAVLTVLGGALLAMAQSVNRPLSLLEWIVLGLAAAGTVSATYVGYFLFRFQLGHDYSYVATARQVDDYRIQLEDYYKRHPMRGADVDKEVLDYIRGEMIASAHDNALTNDLKSAYLNKANVALAICASVTFAAAVPYTVGKVMAADSPFTMKVTIEVR